MRWKKPNVGDIKTKRKFALLPICINRETRWLEWVTIEYVYGTDWHEEGWFITRFVDNEVHENINLTK